MLFHAAKKMLQGQMLTVLVPLEEVPANQRFTICKLLLVDSYVEFAGPTSNSSGSPRRGSCQSST